MKKIAAIVSAFAVLIGSVGGASFASAEDLALNIDANGGVRLAGTVTANSFTGAATSTSSNRMFSASLSGSQEVPVVTSSLAFGSGTVEIDDTGTSINVNLSASGLSGGITAAHIHGPAQPGVSAGILFDLPSLPVQDFRIAVTPEQLQQLRSGLWYFNVHSQDFPNGEIRGQILPQGQDVGTVGATTTPQTGTLTVQSWGGTWQIIVDQNTKMEQFTTGGATGPSTLGRIAVGDEVIVHGILTSRDGANASVTSTVDLNDQNARTVRATSVVNQDLRDATLTGTVRNVDIAGRTFMLDTTVATGTQAVMVFVDDATTLSGGTGTTTIANVINGATVQVTGSYNEELQKMFATALQLTATPVTTPPATTTPDITSTSTPGTP